MKRNLLLPTVCGLALSLAAAVQAATRLELLGDPAPARAATRTIVIAPDTRWVNVTGGEIVKFVAGGHEFVWNFNGPDTINSFRLNQVAPQGALDHPVQAYVAPNPLYHGR